MHIDNCHLFSKELTYMYSAMGNTLDLDFPVNKSETKPGKWLRICTMRFRYLDDRQYYGLFKR